MHVNVAVNLSARSCECHCGRYYVGVVMACTIGSEHASVLMACHCGSVQICEVMYRLLW